MTIDEIKKLVNNWTNMLKEEAYHPELGKTPGSDIIAIVQLQLLLQIYEKLDSVEAGIFSVLAHIE